MINNFNVTRKKVIHKRMAFLAQDWLDCLKSASIIDIDQFWLVLCWRFVSV